MIDKKDAYMVLNDDNKIPAIGLGTYPMCGEELVSVSRQAYKIGYRLFDTSPAYGNEEALGTGLFGSFFDKINLFKKKSVYISTKLFLDACRTHKEKEQLIDSLHKLKVKKLNLWLMHWADPNTFLENYKVMQRLKKEGLAESIGVCNFEIHHLQKILDACDIPPVINQVECHPYLTQKPLIEFCNKYNIILQSYSPFARMDKELINNPRLVNIAKKYNKEVTQIILRWNIQQNRIVIPKTSNFKRLAQNINIFDFVLSEDELLEIDNLNMNKRFRYHPDEYPLEN